MVQAKELRSRARATMGKKLGGIIGTYLLYFVVVLILNLIIILPTIQTTVEIFDYMSNNSLELIETIQGVVVAFSLENGFTRVLKLCYTIVSIPLLYSLIENVISFKRREDTKSTEFITKFFKNFLRSIKVYLWKFLKLLIPSIVYMAITTISILLAVMLAINDLMYFGIVICVLCLMIGLVYIVSRTLLYELSELFAIDNPEMTAKDAVQKSEDYMKGNRWALLWLKFTFIGWNILAMFTCGIGYLFLEPYMLLSKEEFYEEVIKDHGQTTEKEPVAEAPVAEPVVETPVAEEPVVEEQPTQE